MCYVSFLKQLCDLITFGEPVDISFITPSVFWACVILGAAAGFFGGLIGIGGGFILVPGFYFVFEYYLGLPPKEAMLFSLGTAMASILITSTSATRSHLKHNVILWPIFKKMSVSLMLGVGLGVFFATKLDTHFLKWIFAAFCLYSGVRMVLSIHTKPVADDPLNPTQYFPYGTSFGILCGLIGVGGANLVVPFLLKRNATIRQAMATASALQIPISIMGIVVYVLFGYLIPHQLSSSTGFVSLPVFLISGCAIALSTPIGVSLHHALPIGALKRIFGVFAIFIGLHMVEGLGVLKVPPKSTKPTQHSTVVVPSPNIPSKTTPPSTTRSDEIQKDVKPELKKPK